MELAIQQVSELMVVAGIDSRLLPREANATTNFSAAVFADTPNRIGASQFISALVTPRPAPTTSAPARPAVR